MCPMSHEHKGFYGGPQVRDMEPSPKKGCEAQRPTAPALNHSIFF